MLTGSDLEAVLLTGVFGTGKSSVAAEIAHVLEKRDAPYALLDLDFLAWGYPGSEDEGAAEHRMLLKNLTAVLSTVARSGRHRHPGLARVESKS